MKKSLFSIAAALLALGVYAQDKAASNKATPSPAQQTNVPAVADNPNAPEIKFEIEEYNFGTIKQGDKVSYDFKFSNAGKDALVISDARGTCGCTVPQWPKEPIAKGGKGTINVEFNSAGKQGMQDKTVTITSNAKGGAKVLHLKGNVEAPAAATPANTTTPTPEKK
jgi:hypothetical protein